MKFDPNLLQSIADPCFCSMVHDGQYFFLLVHANDYVCTYSNPSYLDAWLQHFKGVPGSDEFSEIKLLGNVESLLQMRIVRTPRVYRWISNTRSLS